MNETGSAGPTPEELDEAYKINSQIDRGELKPRDVDNVGIDNETGGKKEFELTPETEAMIMEKVQDIDTPGLAYTSLASGAEDIKVSDEDDLLIGVLEKGILNRELYYSRYGKRSTANGMTEIKDSEKNNQRYKKGVVYFFIVGRTDIVRKNESMTEISQGKYFRQSV